jgi:hypothetical protein
MSKLARLASRLLIRASSMARSSVSTSAEVCSCPDAAIAKVNKGMAARKETRLLCLKNIDSALLNDK